MNGDAMLVPESVLSKRLLPLVLVDVPFQSLMMFMPGATT